MDNETYNFLKDKLKVKYIIQYINFLSMKSINQDLKKDITTFVYAWNIYKLYCPYDWETNRNPFINLISTVNFSRIKYKGFHLGNDTQSRLYNFKEIEYLCKQKKNLIYNNRLKFFKNIFGISIRKSKNKEIHNFHIERLLIKNWNIPDMCPETLTDTDTLLVKTGGIDINNLIMKFLLIFKPVERLIFLRKCNLIKV